MTTPQTYEVIGLMSGTSGDGTDIAFCRLHLQEGKWSHEIVEAETVPYNRELKLLVDALMTLGPESLMEAHVGLGQYFGRITAAFIREKNIRPSLIASHGHTVFHQPGKGYSFQAGSGAHIAAETGIETVADFRALDVALGGQGAPLVPVGDLLLFGEYDACINLGGIANVSYDDHGTRRAYDICPCNMALNDAAGTLGMAFDTDGSTAAGGSVDKSLLDALESIPYYKRPAPRSMGREDYDADFKPAIAASGVTGAAWLRTLTEHVARQIAGIALKGGSRVLVTGGGGYNRFLMERINALAEFELVIPDDRTVQFKEALIFALLGVLRKRNEVNTLGSVTGASHDSSGGVLFTP